MGAPLRAAAARLRAPPGLPLAVDAVLTRAMAKDPALRHATAGEFAADIVAAVAAPPRRRPAPAARIAAARARESAVAAKGGLAVSAAPAAPPAADPRRAYLVEALREPFNLAVLGALLVSRRRARHPGAHGPARARGLRRGGGAQLSRPGHAPPRDHAARRGRRRLTLAGAHTSTPAEIKSRLDAERRGVPFLLLPRRRGRQVIYELPADERTVTVGRRADNDVALAWDGEVSRVHAELERVGGEWVVVDDGLSRNGTFVNGERVTGRRRAARRRPRRLRRDRRAVPGAGGDACTTSTAVVAARRRARSR